ncbi:hypothetical protein SKAU_G00154960 [Synaphobranchus kaupii]|uniref:DNA 5'-3' helicase n=1 Tax=Synaphobranchus kaupii TaxID=118154 RepID=A0A9Q1FHH5_SYNKA|nr:hypothetical protein SKAU_G00154960 [Synaphobranchus kaupii]
MASPSVEYTIGGVKINFPCKAYPSQLAMMNSIVRGLNHGQHCLLESPTGSGKSLALLCSALAWQQAQHDKAKQDSSHKEAGKAKQDSSRKEAGKKPDMTTPCQCTCHVSLPRIPSVPKPAAGVGPKQPVVDLTGLDMTPPLDSEERSAAAGSPPEEYTPRRNTPASRLAQKLRASLVVEDNDDFLPERKRMRTPAADQKGRKLRCLEKGVVFLDDESEGQSAPPRTRTWNVELSSQAHTGEVPPAPIPCTPSATCSLCPCAGSPGGQKVPEKGSDQEKAGGTKKAVPKIFFGTRTHKQITQITHELKRTLYSSTPMTILSSRKHSCVNPKVIAHGKINECCKELLEGKNGKTCRYYHNVHKMRDQNTLQRVHGLHQAWDIEELVHLGARLHSCAHYAARELMQGANIVFCPYNYLLDPLIRESMMINLKGQVVVLDEAHNIEDSARESASYTLEQSQLQSARDDIDAMVTYNIRPAHHQPLLAFCCSLLNWVQESCSSLQEREYESSCKVWSGTEVVGIFHSLGITPATFPLLQKNLAAVLEKEERVGVVNGREDTVQIPTITSQTQAILKSLFMVLDFLFRQNCKFAEDYRVALQQTYAWTTLPDLPDARGFFGRPQRRRQSNRTKTLVHKLSFWCLNPAVAFSDLSGSVHTIILTSGTLSPMGSFSSELGVQFSIQLEASHVIGRSQGRKLCATFQHAETFAFQDEVGALLLRICQTVGRGVLCFLPSYKMLDKLRDRWTNTGLWEKMEERKTVITEPRGGAKDEFDELLQTYYNAVRCPGDREGALLIAVCRGKVSEGLDFTDDNARAVVTIGIPFPNIKDLQVELKMKYNDQHCKARGLLSGSRWYEIQAYRALNQALGRCIRHKNDWGALILVDDRFRSNPNKYITACLRCGMSGGGHASPSVEYTIGGVKINFPCKAYPSQLAMMNSIVRGLNHGQHCLLESPTGSGKSLALLCSALAWQQAQHDKAKQDSSHKEAGKAKQDSSRKEAGKKPDMTTPCQCTCHVSLPRIPSVPKPAAGVGPKQPVVDLTGLDTTPPLDSEERSAAAGSPPEEYTPRRNTPASRLAQKLRASLVVEDNDDFLPERKRMRTPAADQKGRKLRCLEKGVVFLDDESEGQSAPPRTRTWNVELSSQAHTGEVPPAPIPCTPPATCSLCPCAGSPGGQKVPEKGSDQEKAGGTKKAVPKIFFGTRTHKQITQITHELKRTLYSSTPMTILSSRKHSCVNPKVIAHGKINECCKELLEGKNGKTCRYYHNVHKMRDQNTLQRVHGLHQAWDIEELVHLGARLHSCAHYAARELMQGANIVFCPYNYLLDPLIRESMMINLKGQVVVLDEAHNIEDSARESASYTLEQSQLQSARDDIDAMVTYNIRPAHHQPLLAFCCSLLNWVQESCSSLQEREYESSCKVWSGTEVVGIFHSLGITPATFPLLQKNLAAVLEKEERVGVVNGREDTVQIPTITSQTQAILKSLFMVLDFLFRQNCKFAEDYRVALQQTYAWTTLPDLPDARGFFGRPQRRRQSNRTKTLVHKLSFWCLNPAVAFSDLSGSVHTIILTSGTLSPMGSFSSELGVQFSIQLEASHVIGRSQVWVGTVGSGPQGRKLCATFQHAETFAFQDEVGALLLRICQTVGRGVLCFLPSYKMLDKLRDRWTNTGLWEKMEERKTVITEPRGGAKDEFDELLQTYYNAVRCPGDREGALLIAVCRGKVSEGLDFTDDNARAVVTIGIPFPNIKDLQVELKMKYNDQHCKARGLLSGSRWYEIQAYRALNQALGRCIRHKNDWGALILVDDRFRSNPNKYITGLSKWVRQLVQHHDTFSGAMQSLASFSQCQQEAAVSQANASSPEGRSEPPPCPAPLPVPLPAVCPPPPLQHWAPPTGRQTSGDQMTSRGYAHERRRGSRSVHAAASQGGALVPPQCVYPLFTSTPVCSPFRTPLFKARAGPDCGKGGSCPSQASGTNRAGPAGDTPIFLCGVGRGSLAADSDRGRDSGGQKRAGSDPPCADLDLSPVRAPPCGQLQKDTSVEVIPDPEEDEDQSIFFTPELFEEEEEEEEEVGEEVGEKEVGTRPLPGPVPPVAESDHPGVCLALSNGVVQALSEDLFTPPGGQQGGVVAAVTRQASVRDSSGQEVESQQPSRGTNHRTHRLSRSRQKGVPSSEGDTVQVGGAEAMHVGRSRRAAKRAQVTKRGSDPDGVVPTQEEEEERAGLSACPAPEEGVAGPGERASVLSRLRGRGGPVLCQQGGKGAGECTESLEGGPQRGAVPEHLTLGESRAGRDTVEGDLQYQDRLVGGSTESAGQGTADRDTVEGDLQYQDRLAGGSTEPAGQGTGDRDTVSGDLQYQDRLAGGSTEPAGQGRSASQQDSQGQGVRVQRSHMRRRRRRRGKSRAAWWGQRGGDPGPREAEPQWAGPCEAGLYCAACGWELIPQAEGVVHSAVCELGVASWLWGRCPRTSSCTSLTCLPCESAALLVVEGTAGLQALRSSTQVYSDSGVAAGGPSLYNAMWNPEQGSVSQLLQCKACPASVCAPPTALAVEVHHPTEPARDQDYDCLALFWRTPVSMSGFLRRIWLVIGCAQLACRPGDTAPEESPWPVKPEG